MTASLLGSSSSYALKKKQRNDEELGGSSSSANLKKKQRDDDEPGRLAVICCT
jgi:hypothetical protein